MLRAVRSIRSMVWALALCGVGLSQAQAADEAVERGTTWLAIQVLADGSLSNEATSVALPLQARAETVQTLALLGRSEPTVLAAVKADTASETELLSRRAIALVAGGDSAATLVAPIKANLQAGSGFGAAAGYPANALDTSFALIALRTSGASRDTGIAQALGFLTASAAADGGYGEGQRAYATAYALLALQAWRSDYDLTAAIGKTRTALIGLQVAANSADPMENALSILALSATGPAQDAASAVQALRAAQSANGSWFDDAYLTALALRALTVAANTASGPSRIVGEVLDGAGLPLSGASVSLAGTALSAVTGSDGRFLIENVSAGDYRLIVARTGYQSFERTLSVSAGVIFDVGRINLLPLSGSAILRGVVTDSKYQLPQAGVTVALTGTVTTQTVTDEYGRYEFTGLPAGVVTVTAIKTGYTGGVGQIELEARSTTFYSTWICLNSEPPPSPTEAILKGRVVRASDSSPIAGGAVLIGTATAYTNVDGEFAIPGLSPGAFAASIRMDGFLSVTLSGSLGSGVNDAGQIALVAGQSETDPDASTLAGRVVNATSGAPVRGAYVLIDGTEVAQTDQNGDYRAEGIKTLHFALSFTAAGFQNQSMTVEMPAVGVFRVDASLQPAPEGTVFQVLSFDVAKSRVLPGDSLSATASIAYSGPEARSALVIVRIQDANGVTQATACATDAATHEPRCEFEFTPEQPLNWQLQRVMDNLPVGNYRLAMLVVEPGSMSGGNPMGTVLARAAQDVEVLAKPSLTGSVNASPPVTIPDSPTGVSFTAMLLNDGNAIIPSGRLRLQVRARGETTVVHEALADLSSLQPGDIAEVSFGSWKPQMRGQYDLRVVAVDNGVGGGASGSLVVGDAARATFTVTPDSVEDGNSTVSGRIEITGVDHPEGESADPLFTLVRQAVSRGGSYVGQEAKAWQAVQKCSGCHIQTQTLYGTASALGKAEIEELTANYMHNSQSGLVQDNGRVDYSHDKYFTAQSSLALWSMSATPDRRSTFATRYRVAEYLLGRRGSSGSGSTLVNYWTTDHVHQSGWIQLRPGITSAVVQGIAGVLHDAEQFDIDAVSETETVTYASGTPTAGAVSIDLAPDGTVYFLSGQNLKRLQPDGTVSTVLVNAAGGTPMWLAIADSGEIYYATTAPALVRVTGSTAEVVTRSVPVPVAIDVQKDGNVALLGNNRTVSLIDRSGQVRLLTSNGRIPASAESIATFRDGSLRVVSSGEYGVIRINPDGSQVAEDYGLLYKVYDLAEDADGSILMTQVSADGSGAGVFRIGRNGLAERIDRNAKRTSWRIASRGGRTVALSNSSTRGIYELRESNKAAASLEALRATMEPVARYHLGQGVSDTKNVENAFELIGLAEALPFIEDASLAQNANERITALAAKLRSKQKADGGWGNLSTVTSDPLSTAIVGTALDYLAPAPTDPVLRKTVEYLLKAQRSDGAWTGRYFTTMLGTSSYVMAYLPKAIARLGGIDVGMILDFPANIRLQQPTVTPKSTSALPDGGARYQFDVGRVTAAGSQLSFGLELADMLPLENRPAASAASLTFRNSFDGELVSVPIVIPMIRAENAYALDLSLSRDTFYANETVDILSVVRNLGSSYTSGDLRYFIETVDGALVAELDPKIFEGLSVGSERSVPHAWNAGSTFAGDYRVRVQLWSPQSVLLAEQQRPFQILPGAAGLPSLSGQVSTDKAEYDVYERVTIAGRVRNETSNLGFENLHLDERVTAPNGETVFTATAEIPQLLPSAILDRSFPFDLAAAAPGEYRELQTVSNVDGIVLDTRETGFRVRSTTETGAGLDGAIQAEPSTVEQGLPTHLTAELRNRGNADLMALPVSIVILDPATETVLWTQDAAVDLAKGASVPLVRDWQTAGIAPGDYVAALLATVGGSQKTLAYTPIKVIEPPVQAELSLELTTDNRLLVLVTCRIGKGQAADDQCVADRVAFLDALLNDMGVSHTLVTTTERFQGEFRSGRYNTYWISGGAEKLANTLAEEVREGAFRGEALLVDGAHDSRNQVLDTALGVVFRGQLAQNDHRVLIDNDDFGHVQFAVPGDSLQYDLAGASVQGRFDTTSGVAALTSVRFGRGKAVLHAYDLVSALQASASTEAARSTLDRSLRWLLGTTPESFAAGAYVPVTATVSNLAREAAMELDLAAPEPLAIVDSAPQADASDAHSAYWAFLLAAAESKQFDAGLRMPDQDGAYLISGRVQHIFDGGERELDVAVLDLAVVSLGTQGSTLLTNLRALQLASASERNARDRVVGYVETGLNDLAAGNVESALSSWLRAIEELSKISSVDTSQYRAAIGELMGIAQRRWR